MCSSIWPCSFQKHRWTYRISTLNHTKDQLTDKYRENIMLHYLHNCIIAVYRIAIYIVSVLNKLPIPVVAVAQEVGAGLATGRLLVRSPGSTS